MTAIRPSFPSRDPVCYDRLTSKPVVTVLPIKLGMIAKHGPIGGLQK